MATAAKRTERPKRSVLTTQQRVFLASGTGGWYSLPRGQYPDYVLDLVKNGILSYEGVWSSVHHWNRLDLKRRRPEGRVKASTPSRSRNVAAKKRRKMTAAERRTLEGRFGLRLRELLDAKKWEVGDFQEQVKRFGVQVEKPAIHAWLRGESMPKAKDLEKIGQALGLADYRELLPKPV